MCLAIPSKITRIENGMGTIDVDGVRRTCSLLLLEDAQVGDWVIVHAGFALHKIDEAAARESLALLKEAAAYADEHYSSKSK
ncbi:MAG: HypC/HybG/HupF family hydrogenase formation chaperone [Desulfobacterales bacterium]